MEIIFQEVTSFWSTWVYPEKNFSEYVQPVINLALEKIHTNKDIIKYNYIEKSENVQEAKQNTHK